MAPTKRVPTPLPLTSGDEIMFWENKQLTLETSSGLLQTVLFYLIKCFGVWQGKYLKLLTTESVKYGEDDLGKYVTVDLTSAAKFGKIIRRYEDPQNPRSFYKIIKIYQGHMANEGPLLVRPISSIKDYVCYSPWQLGVGMMDQIANNLMKESGSIELYTNASISMLAVDLLKNLGLGYHCMGTWRQHLFSVYRKDYPLDDYDPCSMLNCEKKNLSLCLLVSRLLDPPYPSDIAELAAERKILLTELEQGKLDLNEVFKNLVIHFSEDNEDIYQKKEVIENNSKGRRSSGLAGREESSSSVQRKKPKRNSKQTKADSDRLRPGRRKRKGAIPASDRRSKVKDASGEQEKSVQILSVASISESSFSVQTDEGDQNSMPDMDSKVKSEKETSAVEQLTLKIDIKSEAMDDSDDLPVTFIKKEIKEEDCSNIDGSSADFGKAEEDLLGEMKKDCDTANLNFEEGNDKSVEDDCLIIDSPINRPVDRLHLLRKLLKHTVKLSPVIENKCLEEAVADPSAEADLSPPVLSPQTKANEEIVNSTLDMPHQEAMQPLLAVSSLPNDDFCCQVKQEVMINSDSMESDNRTEPSLTDLDRIGESQHFVLSTFPNAHSLRNSTSIDGNFPILRSALESRAHCLRPQLAKAHVLYSQPAHNLLPTKLSSHMKSRRTLRAFQRRRVFGSSFHNLTNLKRRHKFRAATTSMRNNARHLSLSDGQNSESAHLDISGSSKPDHSSNATLLNSPLAELQPHSGIYHLRSNQEKNASYQTVKIRSGSGTRLFTIGDLHMEKTASSVVLTSETNIGDYFPEGTMIPANGLKLLTRNGSNGLEVLLKFDFVNGNSHMNNSS